MRRFHVVVIVLLMGAGPIFRETPCAAKSSPKQGRWNGKLNATNANRRVKALAQRPSGQRPLASVASGSNHTSAKPPEKNTFSQLQNGSIRTASQRSPEPGAPEETPVPTESPADIPDSHMPPAPKQLEASVEREAELDSMIGQPRGSSPRTGAIDLESVADSIEQSYPLLEAAILQRVVATGDQVSALGEFDLKLGVDSVSQPLGYYRNYRNGAGVEQPLWGGGSIGGGYRIGVGNFEPWYGGRQTDEGGEFRLGVAQPLMRNRRIDDRRAAVYSTNIDRQAVEPFIQMEFINFLLQGSAAYWDWVAAGEVVKVNEKLLQLALERQNAFEKSVEAGDVEKILLVDNGRLIASRRAAVVDAEQKLRSTAIKLSLFLRTLDGQPQVPTRAQLPSGFPHPVDPRREPLNADIDEALARRPELARLNLDRGKLEVELAQARNLYLPQADTFVNASDDIGAHASSLGDKAPFQLEAGFSFSMPYQRRKALGKIQSIQGKLAQLMQKTEFTRDKITTEVQDAVNALLAAYDRVGLTREGVGLAETMAEAERVSFRAGESNLLDVNIREDAVANEQIRAVKALLDYFIATAQLRAALARDLGRIAGQPASTSP